MDLTEFERNYLSWSPHGAKALAELDRLSAELARAHAALQHIIRRLEMDINDGGRPDQWSMEDLVRTARAALAPEQI